MTDYVKQHGNSIEFPSNGQSWVILSDMEKRIKEKIEKIGKPLKDWDINIYRGILTGCNEAFIIDKIKRDEIIKKDPASAEIIRPILRGRDIKRYGYEFAELYILFIPWHFPLHLDTKIMGASRKAEEKFKEEYPIIYYHLLQYKDILSARNTAETGIRYEWYALQRWGANYWNDFSKQKIVWARLMRISKVDFENFPRFAIADKNTFIIDSLCFITGKEITYLQCVLNSELAKYYFLNNIAILDNGGMQMRQQYIELFPVPIMPIGLKNEIVSKSFEFIRTQNEHINNEINEIIYDAFQFSKQERISIKSFIMDKKNEISQ